jgi:hypothetical protein
MKEQALAIVKSKLVIPVTSKIIVTTYQINATTYVSVTAGG